MEHLDCKSDSSDSSIDLDEPENVTSAAGSAAYIPGVSLSDKFRLAASKGQADRLKALLSLGASFEPDREGRTALHYAAVNGFADTVLCLIDLGCDIDARDKLGYTAMHRAAAQGHLEVIRVLTERGCWIDSQDETNGNTALHEAAWNGYSRTLHILIGQGADVQILNKSGFSAVHMAAQNGHNNSARILLYAGCNPLNKNNYGDTALHTAARYGHAGIARILISARCNINDQNKNADTALHISAALKRRKITKLLVESGIMTSILNRQGETALEVAQRKDHTEIVQLLTSLTKSKMPPVEANWALENGGTKAIHPSLMPVTTNEVPLVATEEEGKKKKRVFFFMKKKKSKDKDRSGDSGSMDTVPVMIPPGLIPPKTSGPVSSFPPPDELMQGFQRHQAQKLQVGPVWPVAPPGFGSGNAFDPSRAGVQYYMDLAGNIIREGPLSSASSYPYPVDPCSRDKPQGGLMLANHIEAANRRLLHQATAADAERRCLDRNFRVDEMSSLEQRVRKQFNMQKGLLNYQPVQGFDPRFATQACNCDWCHGRANGRPHHHGDDPVNRHRLKQVPETPPPGKMYKSKSDETLSTISSHANRQHWQQGSREPENPEARPKHAHRRPKERRDKKQDVSKKCPTDAANGRLAQAKTPELCLDDKELHSDNALVVPANVRDWLLKQGDVEWNSKMTNPNKFKYTEVYDL